MNATPSRYIITAAGGNPTAIRVLNRIESPDWYTEQGATLMKETAALGVEQAGFLIPDQRRFEMSGGEFCGNAARSAALLLSRFSGDEVGAFQMSGYEGDVRFFVRWALISQDLFNRVQENLKMIPKGIPGTKDFAFTKLMTCGSCNSGITAQEKIKTLKDGTVRRYVYYRCSKGVRQACSEPEIREEDLIEQLVNIFDDVDINELGIRDKFEEEIKRINKFQSSVLGAKVRQEPKEIEVDIMNYAKYILREGAMAEKRELLATLRSKLVYQNKTVNILKD